MKGCIIPFPQNQKEKWKIVQKSMERSSLKGKIKNRKEDYLSFHLALHWHHSIGSETLMLLSFCLLQNGALKVIDRKKNIFKLAQGEYIAPEKIETIYIRSSLVSQIFVHGETLRVTFLNNSQFYKHCA